MRVKRILAVMRTVRTLDGVKIVVEDEIAAMAEVGDVTAARVVVIVTIEEVEVGHKLSSMRTMS
jgi:hypothetical protein